jgi:hypothetical protein
MHRRRALEAALVAVLSVPVAAQAGRIAVLAPQLKPPGAAELRDRFHDAAIRGVSKAGDVLSAAEVRDKLAATPDLLNCGGGACVAAAALALRAERVVTVEVEYVGKDYTIRVHAFDQQGNDLGAIPEEKCDICTVREATRAGERAASNAAPLVEKGMGKGGAVAGGGFSEEPAPPPVAPPPVVAPSPPAPVPAPSPAPPPRGAAVTPAPTPPPPAKVETPPATVPLPATSSEGASGMKIGGGVLLGVGAAAIIGMIPFAVYASKEGGSGKFTSCDAGSTDPQHQCSKLYSGNTAPAVILGVGGAAAAVVGGVLLYLDGKNKKRPAAMVAPVPLRDGFAVSSSFEF